MKGINILFDLTLLVVLGLSIYAATEQITTFSDGNYSKNLTYTGKQNQTFQIDFPRYGYVSNLTIRISSLNGTVTLPYEWNINNSAAWGGTEGNATDLNWSSYAQMIGTSGNYLFMNYSILASRAKYNLRVQSLVNVNETIDLNSHCLYQSPLRIRISNYWDGAAYHPSLDCYVYSLQIYQSQLNLHDNLTFYEGEVIYNSTVGTMVSYYLNNQLQQANILANNRYVDFNISPINTNLLNGCVCESCQIVGDYCRMNFTLQANNSAIMNLRIYNLSYSYGVDNCSNKYNIPSSATTLNLSFFDNLNNKATINLTSTFQYNLFTQSYTFSSTEYQLTDNPYCVYPNWTNISTQAQFHYVDSQSGDYFNTQNLYLSNVLQNILLYITPGGSTTVFTIKDINTNKVIQDALCISYIEIGGVYTGVESKYSDITGKLQFSYIENENYKFFCSKEGYNDLIFYLKPVLFSAYDVPMTKTTVIEQEQDYDRVAIRYYPDTLFNNRANNFTFIIGSIDQLTSYGFNLTWNTGSIGASGFNPIGEQLTTNFTITGLTSFDQVRLDYYYSSSVTNKSFTTYLSVANPASNYTMISNIGRHYGLGIYERVLISIGFVLLCAGLGALIGQPVPGFVVGLFILGYLSIIDFFPWWAGAITFVFGAILLMTRAE